MIRRSIHGLLLLLTFLAADAVADDPKPLVRFAAMGDVPYAPEEDILLPKQIAELPAEAEFLIHVGDIKRGSVDCTEDIYAKVAGMLGKSKPPAFIVPGDNEWNDCADPDSAWELWKKHFMHFDAKWKHGLNVARQKELPENFAFVRGGVLFVGINLVGGRVHDREEWDRRHKLDLEWIQQQIKKAGDTISSLVIFGHARPAGKHDDFFKPFMKVAKDFGKPILYLQGDGHVWIHDRPFDQKNILRVQVDRGGIAPPVLVTVTDDPEQPFQFDRRKPKADAKDAAQKILDDSQPAAARRKIVEATGDASVEILNAMVADLKPGTKEEYRRIPWIWRVTVATGKRRNTDEIERILDASLPKEGAPLHDWQAVVVGGGIINGITIGGEWPHEKLAGLFQVNPRLKARWDRALELAAVMADDETVPTPTRYDALRMIALRPWSEAGGQLFGYLTKGTHNELQQAAISGLGDMPSPHVAQALLSGYEHYSKSNRNFALDALLRDVERASALLDAIEAGRVSANDLGETRIQKLLSIGDNNQRARAKSLLK